MLGTASINKGGLWRSSQARFVGGRLASSANTNEHAARRASKQDCDVPGEENSFVSPRGSVLIDWLTTAL